MHKYIKHLAYELINVIFPKSNQNCKNFPTAISKYNSFEFSSFALGIMTSHNLELVKTLNDNHKKNNKLKIFELIIYFVNSTKAAVCTFIMISYSKV